MEGGLVEELLEKLEEVKEESKTQDPPKEPEILTVYTNRVDKNSLYALKAVLPSSKVRTLKFANNTFTMENFKILLECIEAATINKFTFDWNPLPKSFEEIPIIPKEEAKKRKPDKSKKDAKEEKKNGKKNDQNPEEEVQEPIKVMKISPFLPM